MLFAALLPEHESQIARFPCVPVSAAWGSELEGMIHDALVPSLQMGEVRGLGCWDDDGILAALVAYKPQKNDPTVWRVPVLAARRDSDKRHNASTLKRLVLCIARENGALTVVSTVHRENGRMRWLNEKLGATEAPYPPIPKDYVLCTIALQNSCLVAVE